MGVGTIIASAIAILLLIITAYVLIAGTLTTAQTVASAQRAMTAKEAQKIHTRIEIINASTDGVEKAYIEVKNTGSETIRDFNRMEVYLLQGGVPYSYTNLSTPYYWTYTISPDMVHPRLLDPDEVANFTVLYDTDPSKGVPTWVKVTTAIGVYDSAYI